MAVVGLAGGHKASSSWPRRILYAVPFVTMTLGMVLGPSLFESVGVMPVAEFVIFSMIGAVTGLVLYGLERLIRLAVRSVSTCQYASSSSVAARDSSREEKPDALRRKGIVPAEYRPAAGALRAKPFSGAETTAGYSRVPEKNRTPDLARMKRPL